MLEYINFERPATIITSVANNTPNCLISHHLANFTPFTWFSFNALHGSCYLYLVYKINIAAELIQK
jgi:hypothetical protein